MNSLSYLIFLINIKNVFLLRVTEKVDFKIGSAICYNFSNQYGKIAAAQALSACI